MIRARKAVAGLLIGLGAAAAVLATNVLLSVLAGDGQNFLQSIELKTYDWRLTRTADPAAARRDIALVDIDEYSLRNLEPNTGHWPWPRAVHSMLIDFLARAPAKVIVYDVVFSGADTRSGFPFGGATWTGVESDQALADSVKAAGNVIVPVDATFEGAAAPSSANAPQPPDDGFRVGSAQLVERQLVATPYKALTQSAAGFGHNLVVLDADGPLRHTVPFVRSSGVDLPSLGLVGAVRALGLHPDAVHVENDVLRIGDRALPLSRRRTRSAKGEQTYQWALINFRGPALLDDLKSRPYPSYAFFDLLYSEQQILDGQKPNVDPAVFKDKLVFVGITATGLSDAFETPFSRGNMPGMQVHAGVADDILSNRFIREASAGARFMTVATASIAVGLIATLLAAFWATGVVMLILVALGWIATMLFANGYWMNLSQPVLASSIALFGGVSYQYFVEGREKRKMKRLFGQYVSKDVYEQLVANPSLARLGGQRREMTVLFSDIRGFTTVTERGQPEEIVGMLNEYFTRMVDIVFRHRGTVDKFVGDMVMALFGAPLDDPDHADHGVEAALEMIAELEKLNQRWKAQGRFAELDIGVGVNTGVMIAGNIGSDAIMSYTVIGDAVNLGSRLESLNKQYGTRIIISDATRRALKGRYLYRPLGDVVVKGKTAPVAIFEVTGRDTS
jgi:adenylate cyclase